MPTNYWTILRLQADLLQLPLRQPVHRACILGTLFVASATIFGCPTPLLTGRSIRP